MWRVGFIGTGSMGRALITAFTRSCALDKDKVFASDKAVERVKALASDLKIHSEENDSVSVARNSDTIILCVPPEDVKDVIENKKMKTELHSGKCLISIAAGVTINDIKSRVDARVIKIIPSINVEVIGGVSLVCFDRRTPDPDDEKFINETFGKIGKIEKIKEEHFDVLQDLTSCGPAFMVCMMDEFTKAASGRIKSALSLEKLESLVKDTMLGTGRLLDEKKYGFEQIIDRVATKGGITESGIKVLRARLPRMFNKLMKTTSKKRKRLRQKLKKIFGRRDKECLNLSLDS